MMKMAVTTSTFAKERAEPLELLRAAGFEVVLNPHGRKLTRDEAVVLLGAVAGGTGHIGKAGVRLRPPLEVDLLAVDPQRDAAFAREVHLEYGTLAEVLPRCDIVSLHLSGAPKGPLIGRPESALMKRGALIMNLAR